MDANLKGRALTEEEKKEMRIGQELYEMTHTAGWKTVFKWLEDRAFHTWADPREIEGSDPQKQWMWRELNAFYSASNAKDLLDKINQMIDRSEYLGKVVSGEIQEGKRMKI